MKPISIESVCRQVYERNQAEILRQKKMGCVAMPYTREDFSKDVLAGGFILSPTTTKVKWKALEATGIVRKGEYRSVLVFKALESYAGEAE